MGKLIAQQGDIIGSRHRRALGESRWDPTTETYREFRYDPESGQWYVWGSGPYGVLTWVLASNPPGDPAPSIASSAITLPIGFVYASPPCQTFQVGPGGTAAAIPLATALPLAQTQAPPGGTVSPPAPGSGNLPPLHADKVPLWAWIVGGAAVLYFVFSR